MFFKLLKTLYKQAQCSHSFLYVKSHDGSGRYELKEYKCIYYGKKVYK